MNPTKEFRDYLISQGAALVGIGDLTAVPSTDYPVGCQGISMIASGNQIFLTGSYDGVQLVVQSSVKFVVFSCWSKLKVFDDMLR